MKNKIIHLLIKLAKYLGYKEPSSKQCFPFVRDSFPSIIEMYHDFDRIVFFVEKEDLNQRYSYCQKPSLEYIKGLFKGKLMEYVDENFDNLFEIENLSDDDYFFKYRMFLFYKRKKE